MKQIPYYERDVDFDALAKQDSDFAAISQIAKSRGFIDFQNPKIVQQLAKSLLKQDFNLSLLLPDDRLCPPIPVRWNYVRWIQDLLDTTDSSYRDKPDAEREVVGLDIGVGASCIYALLACSARPEWRMAGTDIDAHSLECAQQNINVNDLGERIKLKRMPLEGPILPLDLLNIEELDFTMTNPPFYSSQQDFQDSAKPSEHAATSVVCTGADNEMICEGGDVGFVLRILEQSLVLRERVQWYTAMLSKLASLQQIVVKLKEHGISNYAATSLQPGQKTKRWAVAWSFGDLRPRNDVSRHGDLVHAIMPLPTAQTITTPMQDMAWSGKKVDETIKGLDVRWQWRSAAHVGVMEARANVWSRAARRQKKFQNESADGEQKGVKKDVKMTDAEGEESEEDEPVALAVKITCKNEEVDVRWLRGHDHVVFTSFCGMLKRALIGRA